ncbi:MAG: bifunctional hydroxymethylpyrimidine kinase/phosphomethylpyrimidine kinase [Kiritimatiellia bacterium]|jgi:hydroxymethylpyrimidine/phosphomethylpyrimidine kinase
MDRHQLAALTIAGSDSGGNAGIQADIRAFHVFGLHACTVISALTAQNPYGVRAVMAPDPAFVGQQLDAVLEEYDIAAAKTGMLANAGVIEAVAAGFERRPVVRLVVDPVMVATSGAKLLEDAAIDAMCSRMLPLAALATPNLPEASVILGREIRTMAEMEAAAREIHARHGCAALVKGGHLADNVASDVLFDGERATWLSTPIIEAPLSTHGTGCSLSAAIAASLAKGKPLLEAVAEGKAYVYEAIRTGVFVGPRATVLGMPPGPVAADVVEVDELAR